MRLIIRAIVLLALVWIGLLLSGYGILIGSKENAAGLGLQCQYLTARGTSTHNTSTQTAVSLACRIALC